MSRVVLTIFCAPGDADFIAAALRARTHAPLHLRREAVLGRDYGDAGTAERVSGTLERTAIELELPADALADAVAAVTAARRRLPFRWRAIAVEQGGRVE